MMKWFEANETFSELSTESTSNTLKLSIMDKIQELIPHTILDLQKFVVADAGNSVSAVVEGNVLNAYFVHFEYGIKGT